MVAIRKSRTASEGVKERKVNYSNPFSDTIYKELKLVTGKERINYTEKTASVELIISCPNDKDFG